eukprot:2613097-Pleurochrysis_carterae.AAC.3
MPHVRFSSMRAACRHAAPRLREHGLKRTLGRALWGNFLRARSNVHARPQEVSLASTRMHRLEGRSPVLHTIASCCPFHGH